MSGWTEDEWTIAIAAWVFFGVLCALIAPRKGKVPIDWFVAGALLGPIALIYLVVQPDGPPTGASSKVRELPAVVGLGHAPVMPDEYVTRTYRDEAELAEDVRMAATANYHPVGRDGLTVRYRLSQRAEPRPSQRTQDRMILFAIVGAVVLGVGLVAVWALTRSA